MCSLCNSLELECHGYGPRPEWMDNGVLQREQAFKIRRGVSQTKSRRGRRQQLPTSQPPQAIGDGMCLLSTESVSSTAAPSPIPVDQQLGAFSQDESPYQAGKIDFNSSMDLAWSLWPSNDISAMECSFDLESYNITPTTPQNNYSVTPTTPQNQYPMQHLVSPGSSQDIPLSAPNLPILHEASELSSGIAPRKDFQFTHETIRSTLNKLQGIASQQDRCCPKEATSYDLVSSSSRVSSLSGCTEDTLFMYYLDQVFYVQYPFYDSQNRQGRGWLFSILQRVKPAYHAALALSERHLLSLRSRTNDITNSLARLRDQNGHYDLAIQGTQIMVNDACTSSGHARLQGVEILTPLLQLLFGEVRILYLTGFSTLTSQSSRSSMVEEAIGRRISVRLVVSFLQFYRHGCL